MRYRVFAGLAVWIFMACAAMAQAPEITKVDPPNWWVDMPKPMLLVQGRNLQGAGFAVSDKSLRIERVKTSANGHWAELWLSKAASKPETVMVTAVVGGRTASFQYTFAKRRGASDGLAGFSSKDVMYLIMTDRFARGVGSAGENNERELPRGWHGGNLRGIVEHLDYLQGLGVTTLWITPVYQNHEPDSYHGYGATDMYAVDEHYGSLDDLKTLAEQLHSRGMKLVLDTVPNHVGPAHPWVNDEPAPDWFHGTKAQHRKAQGDFKPLTDPHAPWRDQRDVTEGWFADILPDMNQENPAVAKYLIQNAVWWIEETGADGLRIDTFPYVGRQFWNEFHATVHGLYPKLTTVGEVFNPDATIVSSFAGGVTRNGVDTGLDTPFDFPSYFALRDVFAHDAPMSRLTEVERLDALYPHPERLAPFLGNHDVVRFLNEKGATPQKLKLAFAVLLTMRGTPEIYSGDEIGMRGGEDPDNRRDFPGGFPGDTQNAFIDGQRTPEQEGMHAWVQRLLAIRKEHAALQEGDEQVLSATNDVLVYVRSAQGERIVVAINKGVEKAAVDIAVEDTVLETCSGLEVLLGDGDGWECGGRRLKGMMEPASVVIAHVH